MCVSKLNVSCVVLSREQVENIQVEQIQSSKQNTLGWYNKNITQMH